MFAHYNGQEQPNHSVDRTFIIPRLQNRCRLYEPNKVSFWNSLESHTLALLTVTTSWVNAADDKLVIVFLYFPQSRIWHFIQIVSYLKWTRKDFFLEQKKKKKKKKKQTNICPPPHPQSRQSCNSCTQHVISSCSTFVPSIIKIFRRLFGICVTEQRQYFKLKNKKGRQLQK